MAILLLSHYLTSSIFYIFLISPLILVHVSPFIYFIYFSVFVPCYTRLITIQSAAGSKSISLVLSCPAYHICIGRKFVSCFILCIVYILSERV